MFGDILILVLLISLNGVFAMAEISLVSSRKVRLEEYARRGKAGAKTALELLSDPEGFLSTVQIGITLVGIVAGAYGGLALAKDIVPLIQSVHILETAAEEIALVTVVSGITYLSLVLGELLPKLIALNNPEAFAVVLAPPMKMLAMAARPLVIGLSGSTRFLIRLFRVPLSPRAPMSGDELALLIQQGMQHGTIEPGESEMMQRVLRLDDRSAASVMTPRQHIVWLDITDPWPVIQKTITESRFTKFPVCDGTLDNILGILTLTDYAHRLPGTAADLRALLQEVLFIPEHLPALKILERFREQKTYVGVVVDEYGGVEGVITLHNLVEIIMGKLPEAEDGEPAVFQRDDGSWLVDGSLSVDGLRDRVTADIDLKASAKFSTVSGLMMFHLNKVPAVGNSVTLGPYTLEIVDMDGKRVDKVLVRRKTTAATPSSEIQP